MRNASMFDFLSQKFSTIFSRISGQNKLTQENMQEILAQIKDSLLEADVPYAVVDIFVDSIHKEIIGQKVVASLKPAEQVIKIVYDKLVAFLGGQQSNVFTFQLPSVVMVLGIQGSGKTTSLVKMAHQVQDQAQQRGKKRRILVSSVDFYRPAAVDQLAILAQQAQINFYRPLSNDPVVAAQEIYSYYKKEQYELLFLDTAGRIHIDNGMLEELCRIDAIVAPRYKILVLDAMTGQESLRVAQAFDQAVGFHSVVLTKMDSEARSGAAFACRYTLKKPIIFIGTGERIEDISSFYPERAASRILGMGDMQSLLEKAQSAIKQNEQESVYNSFAQGKITLDDFAQQLDMVNKLGSLTTIMKYFPGMGSMQVSPDMIERGQADMKKFKAIISAMTPKERSYPRILDGSRKKRIALGAGVIVEDVNALLERFEQAQQYAKLFKKFGSKGMFR